MDDNSLKKILSAQDVPAADENAKKRAMNLAMAEFDATQKQRNKISQGSSLWSRLTGSSNNNDRRSPMNKRMIYGGMATAMAVVLVAGISYQELKNSPGAGSGVTATQLSSVNFAVDGTRNKIAPESRRSDDAAEVDMAQVESTRTQGSAMPMPVSPQVSSVIAEESESLAMADARSVAQAPMAPPMEAKMMARAEMATGNFAPGVMGGGVPMDDYGVLYYHDEGRDNFENFEVNPVKVTAQEPVSTFSIDVDTTSYAFARRMINAGSMPQPDAVRIEEMVNYFDYDYPRPTTKETPFQSTVTVMPSPWKDGNKLMHIAIKGYDIEAASRPHANLVFLLDTSGSMDAPDKLPLVKNALKMLTDNLSPDDTVAIVTYAGSAGTVLEPTKVSDKAKIIAALDNLGAGGSTAGAAGIEQAYNLAQASFNKEGVNRVILATDGDFNVGTTDPEALKTLVEQKRETGIFLSVLGFGQGNLNDHIMQELAQNGNGVAAYIDNLNEARKLLVEESSSTLFPIAKDVKIQVEFNPATVDEYRLVGYETRALAQEDFNNDKIDAGDIGAGHTVTAIYEITPKGGPRSVDPSRYTKVEAAKADTDFANEFAFLKIRYKLPSEDESKLITTPVTTANETPVSDIVKREANWAVAVASFGQLVKNDKHTGKLTWDDVITLAQENKGDDEFGYRSEFLQIVRLAKSLPGQQ